jgi:hypothetical protein
MSLVPATRARRPWQALLLLLLGAGPVHAAVDPNWTTPIKPFRIVGNLYYPVVESGGEKDFRYPESRYPPAKVDRVLHDGDQVRLGATVLVAHKTPGHTRGCTTWTVRVTDQGRVLNVVIVGSWNVNPGYRLVDRPGQPASYPGIAQDYQRTFMVLKSLPAMSFWEPTAAISTCWRSYGDARRRLQQPSGSTRRATRPGCENEREPSRQSWRGRLNRRVGLPWCYALSA